MTSPESLRRYPHFAKIPYPSLKAIASISLERNFEAGERLLAEGERAESLIVLTAGQVELVYDLPRGKRVVVGSLVPGDLVAVSAVLDPNVHTLSAYAREKGSLIAIDAAGLLQLCEENPEVGFRLMTQVAKALRARLGDVRVELAGVS